MSAFHDLEAAETGEKLMGVAACSAYFVSPSLILGAYIAKTSSCFRNKHAD